MLKHYQKEESSNMDKEEQEAIDFLYTATEITYRRKCEKLGIDRDESYPWCWWGLSHNKRIKIFEIAFKQNISAAKAYELYMQDKVC